MGSQREALCPHAECGRGVVMNLESLAVVHPLHTDIDFRRTQVYDPSANLGERVTQEVSNRQELWMALSSVPLAISLSARAASSRTSGS